MRELLGPRWPWKRLVLAHEMLDALEDAEDAARRDARRREREGGN